MNAIVISTEENSNEKNELLEINLEVNFKQLKLLVIQYFLDTESLEIYLCPSYIKDVQQALKWLEEDGELE